MDNALQIFAAHLKEYGPSFSFIGYGYMLRVYSHILDVSILERLHRA